ncbi:hypothetical protein GCK72_018932 [Caenorhabditis remanei]|uniref:Secreted protein n=1 Tax=Caenorhabditis remanei TaxID=31234 RepID=A0A6A5GB20_CAERE|nr:hypothetical protein GCK72_018932 [Caenorhabditis remanei]KAF1752377.1 hypothetical protein GCK72_018932 [Caenorhabditis remanei]
MIKKVILLCLIGLAIAKINFIWEFKPVCTRRHAKYVDYGCLLSIRNITKTARETRLTSTIAQEFRTSRDVSFLFHVVRSKLKLRRHDGFTSSVAISFILQLIST